MANKKKAVADVQKVEVDMVPYIDIVTLLLMFLVFVGDMAKSASNVKMKLPKASQAESEKKLGVETEGRIVIQMKEKTDGSYRVVVENNEYEILPGGNNQTILTFLQDQIERRVAKGREIRGPLGEVKFPVKLRIPEKAPMFEVERVVMTCARAGLINVHYAADGGKQE